MMSKPHSEVGGEVGTWCCLIWRKGISGSRSIYVKEGKTEWKSFQSLEQQDQGLNRCSYKGRALFLKYRDWKVADLPSLEVFGPMLDTIC